MKQRPRLVDISTLKPKPQPEIIIKEIPEPLPLPPSTESSAPKGGKNDIISLLINLGFVITLTLIVLWLYHLYIDRKNTIITELKDIEHSGGPQPNQIVIPSNIEISENFNYL